MPASMTTLTALAILLIGAAPSKPPPESITLSNCLVWPVLNGEARVPAREAGVLVEVRVKEGDAVKAGDLLARIDDLEAQEAYKVARFNWEVAKEEAASDVSVRYAKAAAAVARAEYQAAIVANQRVPGTVPETEINRLRLTWERTMLEIEKAETDRRIAALKVNVKQAEAAMAYENLQRRQILSPLDGIVDEIRGRQGEWVKPGDMVMRVIRLDRLRIEGFINRAEVGPNEVAGKPVTVRVKLARGQEETFFGRVDFASPTVPAGGQFRVCAEVENRQQNGHWLLGRGMTAEMTIHLTQNK